MPVLKAWLLLGIRKQSKTLFSSAAVMSIFLDFVILHNMQEEAKLMKFIYK
jgi:hypothetical protein